MGQIIRSENSLNQHIKNKHSELWENIKQKTEDIMAKNITVENELFDPNNTEVGVDKDIENKPDDAHFKL